jgi:hypothetical protein
VVYLVGWLALAETGDALSRDRSILDQFERRPWAACPR